MKLHRRNAWRARNFSLVVITVSGFAVFASLVANYYFEPERVAQRELRKLAQDYYENSFYQTVAEKATDDGNLESVFSEYTERGFPEVRLRQLLLHDGGKNLSSKSAFDAPHYVCDENDTSVVFTPHSPYGVKDYTVTYDTSCQKR